MSGNVGRLFLGVVGGGIGSFFGVPSLGFSVGSLLGGMLFPNNTNTELPAVIGPRLGDLKVQGSAYGNMIPMVFGRVRIAGNLIWTTDIVEHATTVTQTSSSSGGGGKGGGGDTQTQTQSQTTFTYTCSFAIAVCQGPIIGVRKIWANSELIFNVADTADGDTILASATIDYTVYPGSETQTPDPLIESIQGVGLVPAHRGTAYIVFTDFLLTNYGNRMPNFEFEVITSGSLSALGWTYRVSAANNNWTCVAYSPTLRLLAALAATGTGNRAMTSADGVNWTSRAPANTDWDCLCWSAVANRFVGGPTGSTNAVESADGITWTSHATGLGSALLAVCDAPGLGFVLGCGSHLITSPDGINWTDRGTIGLPGSQYTCMAWSPSLARLVIIGNTTGPQFIYSANAITFGSGVGPATVQSTWSAVCWAAEIGLFAAVSGDGGSTIGRVCTSPDGVTWTSRNAASIGVWTSIAWSAEAGLLMAVSSTGSSAMSSPDGITWTTVTALSNQWAGLVWVADLLMFVAVSTSGTGNRIMTYNPFRTLSATAVDLGTDIVKPLCLLGGLVSADVDISGITGVQVDGYVISSRGPVKGMIEPLAAAFFFDAVESENTIRFVQRGTALLTTIPESDLAAHENSGGVMPDAVTVTRTQEVDLPLEVAVLYLNRGNEYAISQQAVRRQVTLAKQSIMVQLPIVMSDTVAMNLAEKTMYSMWSRREQLEFSTTRKYTKYEPTDVIGVTKGAAVLNTMITKREEGANGLIKWMGVSEDISVYTPSSIVGVTSPAPDVIVANAGVTDAVFLDMPELRDADDIPGFYFAAVGDSTGWRGTWLNYSRDGGVNYTAFSNGSLITPSTIGVTTNALGAYSTSTADTFDETSSVTIVTTDVLSSITRDSALADPSQNVIALGSQSAGWEIIQFLTATLIATNTYTLTRLLRGRLGTEAFMSGHLVGDIMVLLDGTIRTITQGSFDLNQSYLYKPVSNGKTLAETTSQSFTNTFVRMKPLAGIQLGGGYDDSGNLTLRWIPRTRYTAFWTSYVDAPVGETSEEYLVVLMLGATEVGSVTVTTPTATITAAQIATYYGSPTPVTITVKIYQISSVVGRGYALTGTF